MALKLDILANTTKFVSEMKKSGASVEEISEALDQLVRDGEKAGDKLEASFRDVARESKKLKDAARDVGKSYDDGFDKAKRSADDFKDEANSTAKETAASFDGSAESIGDAFQEVAANAFAGFGPAGAAAGIAAAVGLGAITSAIQANQEAAEEFRQNLSDMYQEAAEEGRAFLSEAQIQAEAARLIFEDREKLKTESAAIGVDLITLARAYAGSEEDANASIAAANEKLEARLDTMNLEGSAQAGKVAAVDEELRSIERVNETLETQLEWHRENQSAARDVAESQRRGEEQHRAEIEHTADVHAAAQDRLREDASKPITVPFVADTSGLDSKIRNYRPPSIRVGVELYAAKWGRVLDP